MDRRRFLRIFSAATAAVGVSTVCPEVLHKVVEIAADEGAILSFDEVNALVVQHIVPGLVDNFFKEGPVFAYIKLKRHGGVPRCS